MEISKKVVTVAFVIATVVALNIWQYWKLMDGQGLARLFGPEVGMWVIISTALVEIIIGSYFALSPEKAEQNTDKNPKNRDVGS